MQYYGQITPVQSRDYSSTKPRLLQYFTVVLSRFCRSLPPTFSAAFRLKRDLSHSLLPFGAPAPRSAGLPSLVVLVFRLVVLVLGFSLCWVLYVAALQRRYYRWLALSPVSRAFLFSFSSVRTKCWLPINNNVSPPLFVRKTEKMRFFFKKTREMFGGYRENLYLCTRFSELRHTPNTESNEKRVL